MKKPRVDPGRARDTSANKENKGRIAPAPKIGTAAPAPGERAKVAKPKLPAPAPHHRKAGPRARRAR